MTRAARRGKAPGPAKRVPERRASVIRNAIPLAVVAALALTAWVVVQRRHPVPHLPAPRSAADAIAPADAYREAYRLTSANRLRESLPYFHRALAGLTTDFWEVHYAYGIALSALSMQYSPRAGESVPVTRSSLERVGFAREALIQFGRAAELAPDGTSRAHAFGQFANLLSVWGFPWETLGAMGQAQAANPADRTIATRATLYARIMRDPSRYSMDMTVEQALRVPAPPH